MDWKSYIFSTKKLLKNGPDHYRVILPSQAELLTQLGPPGEMGHFKHESHFLYGHFCFVFSSAFPSSLVRMSYKAAVEYPEGIFFSDWSPSETTTISDFIQYCKTSNLDLQYDDKYAKLDDCKAFSSRPGTSIVFRSEDGSGVFGFWSLDINFKSELR